MRVLLQAILLATLAAVAAAGKCDDLRGVCIEKADCQKPDDPTVMGNAVSTLPVKGYCSGATSICCMKDWADFYLHLNGYDMGGMLRTLDLIKEKDGRVFATKQLDLPEVDPIGGGRARILYAMTVVDNKYDGVRTLPDPWDADKTDQIEAARKYLGAASGNSNAGLTQNPDSAAAKKLRPLRSPAGFSYGNAAKVNDNVKFADDLGSLGTKGNDHFLNRFTQYDKNPGTTNDGSRCSVTSAIAICVMSAERKDCLAKFANNASKFLLQKYRARLSAAAEAFKFDLGTYGDLGVLGSAMLQGYGMKDVRMKGNPLGMSKSDVFDMLTAGGITPCNRMEGDVATQDACLPGRGWVAQMTIDGTTPNHYVAFMKTLEGDALVYDPMPMPGHPQAFRTSDNMIAYTAYINNIKNSGGGFVPWTADQADAVRDQI